MPGWLVDDPGVLYALLGALALALSAGWWFTRRRPYLIGLSVVVLLVVVVWLIARFTETDAKQIKGKLEAMAAGVEARNPDQIFLHISKDFQLQDRYSKDAFRQRVDQVIRSGDVQKVEISDVEVHELDRTRRTAIVYFQARVDGTQFQEFRKFRCAATFVLDGDNQWRLKNFKVFRPPTGPPDGETIHLPL
jgi:hypothetical protein